MKLVLPISHLFDDKDILRINDFKCIDTYQLRKTSNLDVFYKFYTSLLNPQDIIYHDVKGVFEHDFLDSLDSILVRSNNCYEYPMSVPCFYSTSLSPACVDVDISGYNGLYLNNSEAKLPEELYELFKQRISFMRRIFNYCLKDLSFENTAYRDIYDAYKYITDSLFISEVIFDNDVGFTLDIAHAIITCRQKNISIKDYFKDLPLKKCKEIHISTPNGVDDVHDLPNKEIMTYLDYVLNYIPSEESKYVYLVCEYYKDFEVLKKFYNEEMQKYAN